MISFGRRWYCTPHILGTGSYEQIISAGGDAEKTLHRGSTPDNGGDLMQPLNDPATWFDREFKLAVPVEVLRSFLEGKLPHHCKDLGFIVQHAQRSSSAEDVSLVSANFRNARKINDENLLKIRQHTPLEVLQSGASTLCGRKWLATSDSVTTFKSRNLESIYVSLVPDVWASQNSLPLIAGESGSGKTWLMLHLPPARDAIGIYIPNSALIAAGWNEEQFSTTDSDADRTKRDNHCKDVLVRAIRNVLPTAATKSFLLSDPNITYFIALDELGSVPMFVRALCRVYSDIPKLLKEQFGFGTVRVVAAGTGVDSSCAVAGSLPETYRIITMPSASPVWLKLLESLRSEGSLPAEVLTEAEEHPSVKAFSTNARLAAIMFEFLRATKDARLGSAYLGYNSSPQCRKAFILQLVRQTAMTYKKMNGLAAIPPQEVDDAFSDALQAVLFPHVFKSTQMVARVTHLIVSLGVITDRAVWEKKTDKIRKGFELLEGDGQVRLVAPIGRRYAMSPAQLELFQMHYGLEVAPPTGDGFEYTVARYAELVLLASCNDRVECNSVLRKLGMPETTTSPAAGRLTHTGVTVLQSHQKIEPGSETPDVKAEVEKHLKQNCAVVLINAPQAAFGDVIIFVPKHFVVVLQAKFYAPDTPFFEYEAWSEIHKMGHVTDKSRGGAYAASISAQEATKYGKTFVKNERVQRKELFDHLCNDVSLVETLPRETGDMTTLTGTLCSWCSVSRYIVGLVTTKEPVKGIDADVMQLHAKCRRLTSIT